MPFRILCLSNGHGEDLIASRILLELQTLGVEAVALPVVGEGHAYRDLRIRALEVTQAMPSGGFIYQDWRQLLRDLRGGLLGLTGRQLRAIRAEAAQSDLVLGVGDIVVLLMSWWSGAPYAFVGTAKSDYYWRDESGPYRRGWIRQVSDYLPWERWLMRRSRGVFPRDSLTAAGLRALGLPVFDLGNPMMDGLEAAPLSDLGDGPALLLLPGSRPPEGYRNWQQMAEVVRALPPQIRPFAAIAPSLSDPMLTTLAADLDIPLYRGRFAACAQRADIVLAMAGTATEQCVGLGKPVVILPGKGPQFTYRFAEAQTRLLGSGVHLCQPQQAPQIILNLLERLGQDPGFRARLREHGRRRLGTSGAGQRIARQIVELIQNNETVAKSF